MTGVEKDRGPWGRPAGIRSEPGVTADVCPGQNHLPRSPLGFEGPREGRSHQGSLVTQRLPLGPILPLRPGARSKADHWGLHGGRSQGTSNCWSWGRASKELEGKVPGSSQGHERQLWLSNFSSFHFPSPPSKRNLKPLTSEFPGAQSFLRHRPLCKFNESLGHHT